MMRIADYGDTMKFYEDQYELSTINGVPKDLRIQDGLMNGSMRIIEDYCALRRT